MSIFDFGKKQRLETQMYGNTSGREMFVIDEYNEKKSICGTCIAGIIINLLIVIGLFYFGKIQAGFILIIPLFGLCVLYYFQSKEKKRLYEKVLERY